MKTKHYLLTAALLLLSFPALSAGFDQALRILRPSDIPTLAASSIVSSTDYFYVYDDSLANITKVLVPDFLTSTATGAQLNYLAITTLGTGAASKAVVLDASGNYTAPATGTITLPSGYALTAASGSTTTLAGTVSVTGTATLTAPVANNPVITGPAPVACGSTCTLGATAKGTYVRLDTAAGSVATLPSATGSGTVYRLYVSVANSSNADKVLLATTSDTIIGTAQGENAATAKFFVGNAGTYHSIQMPFAGTQPSGGFVGDTIICTDVASTVYKCDIMYQAGTTPTTPYNASTT